jgi:putative nucleotidyltransferase with HDIG domain
MPVDDVRDAVVRLGAATLLELVLGDYMRSLRTQAPLYHMAEDELWAHGAAAGLAVRALQLECPRAGIPQLARTAALVHDIGKLLMVRAVKADPAAVLAMCRDQGITWVEAERRLFGFDHAVAGAVLARAWSFPKPMVEAIEHHHDSPIVEASVFTDAVVVANLVAKSIGVGLGAEGMNFNVDPGLSQRLGLSFPGFSRVCIQTAAWLKEIRGGMKAA